MTYRNHRILFRNLFHNKSIGDHFLNFPLIFSVCVLFVLTSFFTADAQVVEARRTDFAWINTENVTDNTFGSGFLKYCDNHGYISYPTRNYGNICT